MDLIFHNFSFFFRKQQSIPKMRSIKNLRLIFQICHMQKCSIKACLEFVTSTTVNYPNNCPQLTKHLFGLFSFRKTSCECLLRNDITWYMKTTLNLSQNTVDVWEAIQRRCNFLHLFQIIKAKWWGRSQLSHKLENFLKKTYGKKFAKHLRFRILSWRWRKSLSKLFNCKK